MRRTYSQVQISKISKIIAVVGDQYSLLILFELTEFGEKSFNDLKRMTDINAVTLIRKLRFLEDESFVKKRPHGKEVLYSLTPKANKLKPIIDYISSLK